MAERIRRSSPANATAFGWLLLLVMLAAITLWNSPWLSPGDASTPASEQPPSLSTPASSDHSLLPPLTDAEASTSQKRRPTATPTAKNRPTQTATPTAAARASRPAAKATQRPPQLRSGLPAILYENLPPEAHETIQLIDDGGPFPFYKDGSEFQNRERILPRKGRGYYREYTVITPGEDDRGARRIVAGARGELYYTDDHYDSFWEIVRQ